MHLSRYIHRNPVTAGLVDDPAKWEFSSYPDFLGIRDVKGRKTDVRPIPEGRSVLMSFSSLTHYRSFVESVGPELPARLQHLAIEE